MFPVYFVTYLPGCTIGSAKFWHGAELLQEAQGIELHPFLRDLAIDEATDNDPRELYCLPRRGCAREFAGVAAAARQTRDDLVPFGDLVHYFLSKV